GIHAAQMESGEGGAGPAALHNAYRTGAPEKEQAVAGLLRRGARSEGRRRKAGQFEVSWCEIPTRVGSHSFRRSVGRAISVPSQSRSPRYRITTLHVRQTLVSLFFLCQAERLRRV